MAILARTLHEKREGYRPDVWDKYRLLYEGGHKIEAAKATFLPRRPAESDADFAHRMNLFTYRNLVAPAVDEIVSATLQAPVTMNRAKEGEKRPEPAKFYTEELFKDPAGDGKRSWNDLFLKQLTGAMQDCEAYFFVVFEDAPGAQSLADQEAAGALRARVECVEPQRLINSKRDRDGLVWVMLFDREKLEGLEDPKDKLRWTRIGRQMIERFELVIPRGEAESLHLDDAVTVLPPVPHRFGKMHDGRGAVPIVELCFEDGLWLLDRLALIACEELRKRNGLAWYEEVACFPQPYHKGQASLGDTADEKGAPKAKRGAKYVVELEIDGEYGYAEPSGSSLEHLSKRLEQLEQNIRTAIHDMASATGPAQSAQIESAASKVRDSVAKRILCERYAKSARDAATKVCEFVAWGRQEPDHRWEASGADRHDLAENEAAVDELLKIQGAPDLMQSETFRREITKQTARGLLLAHGTATATLDQVDQEFDAAKFEPPTPPEPEGPV